MRSNTGTGIQIPIPSHIRPSSLSLRFPDHASRTVRIVLRDAKGGNVLFDSATSKNVEARNNAIHSARTFLLSNQSEKDSFSSSKIIQRIDLQDFKSLKNLTIELSRLNLPLLLQNFADSVPSATKIPGRSAEAYVVFEHEARESFIISHFHVSIT